MRRNEYWENFVKENKDVSWHFDPGKKTQDYTYVGKLKIDFILKSTIILNIESKF